MNTGCASGSLFLVKDRVSKFPQSWKAWKSHKSPFLGQENTWKRIQISNVIMENRKIFFKNVTKEVFFLPENLLKCQFYKKISS